MALVSVHTARVEGAGSVTCRRCQHKTIFPASEWIEFLDNGTTMLIQGVREGLVCLHRCGRNMVWVCDTCGFEAEHALLLSRSFKRQDRWGRMHMLTRCMKCATGTLKQVEKPLGAADVNAQLS